jgi:predicted alpha/beta hydrolase family esterase
MKNAIIVHGMPSKREDRIAKLLGIKASRFHWLGWLGKQLRQNGYEVWAPEMPKPYAPDWDIWVKEAENAKIGPNTLLIGHSCGAGFWLRYLSEHKDLKVGRVVLVAPWIDVAKKTAPQFFDFRLDPDLVSRTKEMVVFYSDNDMKIINLSVDKIRKEVKGVNFKQFKGYGHFTLFQMRTRKFPELLKECLAGNT